jgi:hypothetical protein
MFSRTPVGSDLLNGKLRRSSHSEDEKTESRNLRHAIHFTVDRARLKRVSRQHCLASSRRIPRNGRDAWQRNRNRL